MGATTILLGFFLSSSLNILNRFAATWERFPFSLKFNCGPENFLLDLIFLKVKKASAFSGFEELIINVAKLMKTLIKDLIRTDHKKEKLKKKRKEKNNKSLGKFVIKENNYAEIIKELYLNK